MNVLRQNAKAIVAFLVPVLGQLQGDLGKGVTGTEMIRNLTVSFLTAVIVWAVPNKK